MVKSPGVKYIRYLHVLGGVAWFCVLAPQQTARPPHCSSDAMSQRSSNKPHAWSFPTDKVVPPPAWVE